MATDSDDAESADLVVGPQGLWPLPWIAPWVRAQVAGHRGHALLIHGAAGDGVASAAVSLAQAWLCESTSAAGPCGACAACHAVQGHAHPDLMLLLPEKLRRELAWPLIGDKAEDGEGAEGRNARKPSRQLRIEEVRAATDWVATTSSRGRGKVLVLHPATALNAHAANALLKTLEEPPRGVRIVLTATDPQRLLPTVRSRCQLARLQRPTRAEALAWLEMQGVTDGDVLLAGAGEQPLVARRWSRAGIDAARWLALADAVRRGRAEVLQDWPLPQAIELLQRLCHDALRSAVGGAARFFKSDVVAAAASIDRLLHWQRSLGQAARHDEHPWQEALLIEALVDEGAKALAMART